MKHVFITGATGYLGQRLALHLAENGCRVHALVRDRPKAEKLLAHPQIDLFEGCILKPENILAAADGCEEAYHLAALASVWNRDPGAFDRMNVLGLENVLSACGTAGVKNILFTSTAGVVGHSEDGNPVAETTNTNPQLETLYERSKVKAEEVAKQFVGKGLRVVVVNPSRVYGPGLLTESNGFTRLMKMYLSGRWKIQPGNGGSIGNYVFVDDVINGFLQAMEKARPGERYLLGGEDVSYTGFFDLVSQIDGRRHKLYNFPLPVMLMLSYVQLGLANSTGRQPLITPPFVRKYTKNWLVSSEKAKRELGYTITPLKTGLQKTIDWLKQES